MQLTCRKKARAPHLEREKVSAAAPASRLSDECDCEVLLSLAEFGQVSEDYLVWPDSEGGLGVFIRVQREEEFGFQTEDRLRKPFFLVERTFGRSSIWWSRSLPRECDGSASRSGSPSWFLENGSNRVAPCATDAAALVLGFLRFSAFPSLARCVDLFPVANVALALSKSGPRSSRSRPERG